MEINRFRVDLLGLSDEDKPENAVNGTTYYEVDTTDLYIFYEGEWYLQKVESEEQDEEELIEEGDT